MPHQPAKLGSDALRQGLGGGLLVLGLEEPDLDQLVVEERCIERADHGPAEPGLTHAHHWPQGVSLATKPFSLRAAKGRMGCGGAGHVQIHQGGNGPARGQGRGKRFRLACAPAVLRLTSLPLLLVLAACASPGRAPDSATPARSVGLVSARPPSAEPLTLLEAPVPESEAPQSGGALRARVLSILEARAPALSAAGRAEVAGELARAKTEQGLSAWLLLALMEQESGLRPRAVGPRGSIGLMQIRPFVAADVAHRHELIYSGAHDLSDPLVNVRIGIAFLSELRDEFGDVELALAAYHIGPTRLRARLRRGRRPRGPYVRRVMARYQLLRIEAGELEAAIGG